MSDGGVFPDEDCLGAGAQGKPGNRPRITHRLCRVSRMMLPGQRFWEGNQTQDRGGESEELGEVVLLAMEVEGRALS